MKASGGEWNGDLMFNVPRDHQEIQRLEGRYKNQGGVQEGKLVELSNGRIAYIARCDESTVVLDCNSMLAGKELTIELELTALEKAH